MIMVMYKLSYLCSTYHTCPVDHIQIGLDEKVSFFFCHNTISRSPSYLSKESGKVFCCWTEFTSLWFSLHSWNPAKVREHFKFSSEVSSLGQCHNGGEIYSSVRQTRSRRSGNFQNEEKPTCPWLLWTLGLFKENLYTGERLSPWYKEIYSVLKL